MICAPWKWASGRSANARPRLSSSPKRVEDLARDQIEYPQEEPFIRQKFEAELAQRGLKSIMPEIAYQDPNYEWDYEGDD